MKARAVGFCLNAALAVGASFFVAGVPAESRAGEAPEEFPAENFSTVRTEFFSVSAETPEAANRVGTLAREVETCFLRSPRLWRKFLPPAGTRVGVELFAREGIFGVRRDAEGRLTLFVSEAPGNDARAEIAFRGILARALILRALPPDDGRFGVPAWIETALAEESRIGNVPGRRIFLKKRSERVAPPSLKALIEAPPETFEANEDFRVGAIWLLRCVEDVSAFFDTKKTTDEKIAAAFPRLFPNGKFDAGTAEKFWATRFRAVVSRAPGGVDLPEESRRGFDDALLFLVERDGEETRLLGVELVSARLNAEIRALVSARLADFVGNFRKVNPIWHNAFAEYGLFLEMFGDPDVSDETLAAQWAKALLAREDALALSAEVRALLESSSDD